MHLDACIFRSLVLSVCSTSPKSCILSWTGLYPASSLLISKKALGFPISHADSHHHAHTIFTLKEVFCEVLKRQGIMKVRLGADFRSLRMKAHLFQWLKRNRLNGYYKKAFCTTNAFYSFSEFLKANCSMCDNETYELMCHPGHPGKKYRKEIESIEMNLLPKDIKLISYNDIH